MEQADVDRRLDGALERLPAPQAPGTLLLRVMQAVESRAHAPWYRRAWRLWPLGWQALSLVASAGLVAFLGRHAPSPMLMQLVARDTWAPAHAVIRQVEPTVAALQILWRVALEPLVPLTFALAMLMCVASVAIGLTLNFVLLGRTWQR